MKMPEVNGKKPIKVSIGFTYRGTVVGDTVPALMNTIFGLVDAGYYPVFRSSCAYPCDMARNEVIDYVAKDDSDYLLFIDADMFPTGKKAAIMIKWLEENKEYSIATGLVFKRLPPYEAVCGPIVVNPDGSHSFGTALEVPPGTDCDTETFGMSFTAIRMKDYREKIMPYLKKNNDLPFHFSGKMSEDLYFARHCHLLKLKARCLLNVMIPHIGLGTVERWTNEMWNKSGFKMEVVEHGKF